MTDTNLAMENLRLRKENALLRAEAEDRTIWGIALKNHRIPNVSEAQKIVNEKALKFVNENREELVRAFIAKTGLQPDECELVEQLSPKFDSMLVQKVVYVRRTQAVVPPVPNDILSYAAKHEVSTRSPLVMLWILGHYIPKALYMIWESWLAECDKAGCIAAQVADALRAAGRENNGR